MSGSVLNTFMKGFCTICRQYFYYYWLFGCLITNFGPLLREKPHSPDVNYFQVEGHQSLNEIGSLSLTKHLLWV